MRFSFRYKLTSIIATAAVAFMLVIFASTLLTNRVQRKLDQIQALYVPRIELEPNLRGHFDAINRAFQDAVASRDPDSLAKAQEIKSAFLSQLSASNAALDPVAMASLRTAFDDYFSASKDVSQRLIKGETGEALVEAMGAMQNKRRLASELLSKTTAFDKREMAAAFHEVNTQLGDAGDIRMSITVTCMLLVTLLSYLIGRGLVRSLSGLSEGFERFGADDFSIPIEVRGSDELADVAAQANQMAKNLRHLGEERGRVDWQKNGLAGLVKDLRGELEPQEVADQGAAFLARYLGAPAAAIYYCQQKDTLRLLGKYGGEGAQPVPQFHFGEGLVGEAAQRHDLMVVSNPPPDYLRIRSGLGEAPPQALVLVPLLQNGKVRGVLELALFKPLQDSGSELLLNSRETLTIALEVSLSRAETRSLLAETQAQAQRLSTQEEELRSTNEELQAQQEELRQTNEELAQQAEELDMQRHMLQEKLNELELARQSLEKKSEELSTVSAYKSQFLTNMSHELRTPLNSMLLLSNLLAENETGSLSEKQVEFSKTIHAAGKDLLALINQVLDLAKIEAGQKELRVAEVNVAALADRARRVFEPQAKDKKLGFTVQVDSGLPKTLLTDHQRADQIITNLLGNAFKFTDAGQVTLRIGRPLAGTRFKRQDLVLEKTAAFEVTDTGPGIAPEHQERIFAPFEQVESKSDRRYGGTGLGLSIARELTALLGGELQLKSAPGQGSTFTCFVPFASQPVLDTALGLPLPPAPTRDAAAASARTAAAPDDRLTLKPEEPYLLIIEDDRIFAEVFGEVIRSQGLRYVWVPDAAQGLEQIRAQTPSGIILDVKLPGTDGFTFMQQLKADPSTADIPIHFASALDAADRGMALGAAGYLTKPASKHDLIRAIHSLVPRLTTRPSALLVVEDDAMAAQSLMKQLASEGVEARHVGTAALALETLRQGRFGCVILDLSLPDMDGLDLLEKIQQQSGADMPSVVIYTARALSRAETKRLEAYTEAIVLKEGPSVERLLNEVRLFTRRLKAGLANDTRSAPRFRSADVRLEGRRLLVVDDDMRTVYALSATLRAKGAHVLVGDTGRVGIEMLNAHPDTEALLIDIMMPEMDGYEAMRRIRQDPRFAQLPIIALTAKAMKGDEEKCLEAGASDYLPKPIDPDRLLALLHARLNL
ncbi:MAG: response regulator [Myxococcaceae bacterium]|nr:response regulator [Myxococcaceae bacterium]